MRQNAATNRKKEILDAALKEFIRNGEAGARLQSIADEVGVTKAMIHYYFDTKGKLFQQAFREACRSLFGDLMGTLETGVPLLHKIDQFVKQALDRFHTHPELTEFVVTELNRNSNGAARVLWEELSFDDAVFTRQLQAAASNYEIAPVDSRQVLANILSLCMFPCTGHIFIKELLHINNEQEYRQFLEQRSNVVSDTIINWLTS